MIVYVRCYIHFSWSYSLNRVQNIQKNNSFKHCQFGLFWNLEYSFQKISLFKIKKRGRRISQAYLESDDDIEGPIEEVINSVSVLVNINKVDSLCFESGQDRTEPKQTLSSRQGTTKADQMLGPRLSWSRQLLLVFTYVEIDTIIIIVFQ